MIQDFKALRIKLSSPDDILAWSHGEVKKAETINYRTQRAEVDGLMCEKIFGPTKNFECYCGKYKKIRYKGIICDKCGVEVTHKRVRRERMGHIKLASPIVHVWYSYGVPNKLAMVLDIPQKKLETVIYFARYAVLEVDADKKEDNITQINNELEARVKEIEKQLNAQIKSLNQEYENTKQGLKKEKKKGANLELQFEKIDADHKKKMAQLREIMVKKEEGERARMNDLLGLVERVEVGEVLSQEEMDKLMENEADFFKVQMGAEAIKSLLERLDLEKEVEKLEKEKRESRSVLKLKKANLRYKLLKSMLEAGIKPEWIVVEYLPVIPPDLRPIIQLPGGRFATSDLNDLYRRVINRNNRLKKLIDLGAPEIILRNEKRMLQEAVDALLDNSHRPSNPVLNSRNQPYKSLSDMLRGKQGRFRQNLLGKRVDYSGRAVIVAGPDLKINECGLPKAVALELFRPFIIREILARGYAANIKAAKTFFDERSTEVYDILEDVIKERPVLLNRAPTLHKQGIQGFYPVLTEGNAIRINPLVCKGFNADFDGDQMAVHVPLSKKAVDEVIAKMMPDSNILLMRDGSPVVTVARDIIVGCYYLSMLDDSIEPSKVYSDIHDALKDFHLGLIKLGERIKVLLDNNLVETTAGRIAFNKQLPSDYVYVNKIIDSAIVSDIVSDIYSRYGSKQAIETLDKIKEIGLKYVTRSGLSISINDYKMADRRDELLALANQKEEDLNQSYMNGLLSVDEKLQLSLNIWTEITDQITKETMVKYDDKNPLIIFDKSGGLSVKDPLRQSAAIRGLILDAQGRVVPLPLRSNYKLGLNAMEYFVAAKGTRKGLADTALKTSESGYLTRKFCDVAQDVITRIEDCETKNGQYIYREANRRLSFDRRITGMVPAEDVLDPNTKEILAVRNEMINKITAEKISAITAIDKIKARSVLTCEAIDGVCAKCYGSNLSTQKMAESGLAIGIIAGQAMGEAATQLTLNTKHLAARVGTDITKGLPRVEELFEARTPRGKSIISEIDGKVNILEKDNERILRISSLERIERKIPVNTGDTVKILRARKVKAGEVLVVRKDKTELKAPIDGAIRKEKDELFFEGSKRVEIEHELKSDDKVLVQDGDKVVSGQQLTDGAIDPKELMLFGGVEAVQQYIIENIQDAYGIQGIALDDKHISIVVRKMTSLVRIVDSGDSKYIEGEYITYYLAKYLNKKLKAEGKRPIKYIRQLLGITTAALKTESFLSAASFQEQVRVLSEAALLGRIDYLKGLKENVIIGRPVPLGENNLKLNFEDTLESKI